MKKKLSSLLLSLLLLTALLAGCGNSETAVSETTRPVPETTSAPATETTLQATTAPSSEVTLQTEPEPAPSSVPAETSQAETVPETTEAPTEETLPVTSAVFNYASLPDYSGSAFVAVNDNVPFFSGKKPDTSFERYSPLDSLGRCGVAYACIGRDLMPTEERGSIGMVKPTGWHTIKYDFVDGKYLYNRCHLIGFQLTGENANTANLITGTRYLNIEGMLPFENMTADYIKETGNHVLYRVTPIFIEDELLCRGVLMEGLSLEDNGEGLSFCVFAYNVQPGAVISYADGSSTAEAVPEITAAAPETGPESQGTDYIANKNSKKFHYPTCSSVDQMKESNKVYLHGTREEIISQGYEPCKRCKP